MPDWIVATIPIFKIVHIAALTLWCGGLLAMPLMLARSDRSVMMDDYRLIRRATHLTYTLCVTPAAVIAVIAGTWLIFLREAFVPWMFAKLVFVSLLVVAHVWTGNLLVRTAEEPARYDPPRAVLPLAAVLVPVIVILTLVLAKPGFHWIDFPQWMLEPRGGQLPFDVPSR